MSRKLLLLIAILATMVVLGCWDNRRQIQRVLDEGYATTAQITGAQYQRRLPLAADGWRPRFVEQELSVDLSWQGRDGKAHTFHKVPISETFARTVVNGEQVRLITLPVKVLDDESAPPVIAVDASGRLASIQSWLAAAGYAALAGWAGFAALTLLPGKGRKLVTAAPAERMPPKRTFVGLGLLVIGGFLAFNAWSSGRPADSIALGGQEVTADIVDAMATKTGHAVRLAWRDGQGAVHHYGPIPISQGYWDKITQAGQLTVKQAAIRYRADEGVPPLIVDDAPEQHWSTRLAMGAGLVLMMFGAAFFSSGLRARRNVTS